MGGGAWPILKIQVQGKGYFDNTVSSESLRTRNTERKGG